MNQQSPQEVERVVSHMMRDRRLPWEIESDSTNEGSSEDKDPYAQNQQKQSHNFAENQKQAFHFPVWLLLIIQKVEQLQFDIVHDKERVHYRAWFC